MSSGDPNRETKGGGASKDDRVDRCFGVASSGRSGGLCMFWKNDLNVDIISFSKYHIDSLVGMREVD
jgi:hypothetical protein